MGKLTEVNVRDLWKHEQYDFSAWLAKEENITELGDVIGLNLVDVNTEVSSKQESLEYGDFGWNNTRS